MRARRVVVSRHVPPGQPLIAGAFAVEDFDVPSVGDGQLLVEVAYLSVDPYLRRCLLPHSSPGFPPTIPVGQAPVSRGVGRVLTSRNPGFAPGDVVVGSMRWEEHTVTDGHDGFLPAAHLAKIEPRITSLSNALGVQGLTGMNAYFGVLDVARPRHGETIVVSGAAGAVGSIAGQIAGLAGATVVGLTGSDRKCDVLTRRLGFHHALNYRSPTLRDQLRAICPGGPDIYFDNVGGELSQTIMWQMRKPARIVECGQISTYDTTGWLVDIYPLHANQLTLTSVLGSAYVDLFPAAIAQLGHWLDTGQVVALETVSQGIESGPEALEGLFHGSNIGKSLVRVR